MLPMVLRSKLAKPMASVNRSSAISGGSRLPGSPAQTSLPFLLGRVDL